MNGNNKRPLSEQQAAEYKIIKKDLIRVVLLNVVYLAAVIALFLSNQKSHYLERWFSKLFHF